MGSGLARFVVGRCRELIAARILTVCEQRRRGGEDPDPDERSGHPEVFFRWDAAGWPLALRGCGRSLPTRLRLPSADWTSGEYLPAPACGCRLRRTAQRQSPLWGHFPSGLPSACSSASSLVFTSFLSVRLHKQGARHFRRRSRAARTRTCRTSPRVGARRGQAPEPARRGLCHASARAPVGAGGRPWAHA